MCVSCSNNYTPRPYGYYRISVPDTAYTDFQLAQRQALSRNDQRPSTNYPYTFALSKNAVVKPRKDVDEPYWINIYYPVFDATIHCSYKPVRTRIPKQMYMAYYLI